MVDDRFEECHDWSDDCCNRISDYMHKLSSQREKNHKRKIKVSSSSSSFSDFSPSMSVPLCQLPSSAGAALACLAVLQRRQVDCCSAPEWLRSTVLSPLTCVAGTLGANILLPRVSLGVSASEGGL